MKEKYGIEIARKILNNATNMYMKKEIILKISQKIDKYIVEYYQKGEDQKDSGLK
ncbi:Spo0E family sporulation regulatory protein-aspartic acid phosphatase [Aceticella autotrophica]|uniref:Spo0E family sporulation regulatory protein-aspartic acid phosphatase n=1 Tax=Aceticella autotrophica TaxID=2755338 RepID=A0A975GAA9_9THEO|nr:aspartyl-phosphate phosphatase Spo0E family protein [Aceticella autotrophica]QSZ27070.1 Spo0E family sporulation regulatory protein-aspartic acid phosphatase [Aceticella autotrophica]